MGDDSPSEKPLRSEVLSISLTGLVATLVSIVVTIEAGSSTFELIGLAEASVRETKGRVLSALARLGKWLDGYKVKVEFSPVGLRNDGMCDLAIAVAVLMALENKSFPRTVFLGELAMTAAVRPVRGTLPALLGVKDIPGAIVAWGNGNEAACVQHMEVRVAAHLHEVIEYLQGTRKLTFANEFTNRAPVDAIDMMDVRGLLAGRRAVEISAAGLHPLLFIGSPGSGKTMLCRRLPTVMPPLSREEALEVTSIHSVAGLLHTNEQLFTRRPLRAPHHTVSEGGLVGGGEPVRPGEVSLAHHGVLFLDDMQEFKKKALEVLDGVLKQGKSVLCQRQIRVTFPARPLTVAGVLPCPCGFNGTKNRTCNCPPERLRTYRERLRGAVFDHMDMKALLSGDEVTGPRSESSAEVRARVVKAGEVQHKRFERLEVTEPINSRLSLADLERVAKPDKKGLRALEQAVERLGLSAELRAKVLRVSRTIADLDGSDAVRVHHIAEAVQAAPQVT
ncbi:YifB family Mg chelatase-like AAA ATPase [Polyangium aurulentum]|uniref:YifB family Mg chelatase-like AAA ATPase n=1 Tax=Polyangium aurulentum TaxID=2567896 RepID=UPI0010AE0638|nr:YifB family Mg chelatase-like AAA ATPase [Polyangium aurulentum]UQA57448.1 YifB family Mg chelatase-like AAA ATPase [Polyangium aurulentum]